VGTITVNHLGKAYRQYSRRWGRLAEWFLPDIKPLHALHWVLKDISFTVEPGEAVGIIGVNGAGKSTLLKIITGTTAATTGRVHVTGRVSALLELGIGFHPEFTGRQNAIMAAQLLGLNTEEVYELMPAIEAFADIGDYLDQPVRIYSSGMQMRLAFSVATAHRPDVLIVDEALAVGDAAFQHKCIQRIKEFRDQGTTLLFVSHSADSIKTLCNRAILIDSGQLAYDGAPDAVLDFYNARLADLGGQHDLQQTQAPDGRLQTRSGNNSAAIDSVELLDEEGRIIEVARTGQTLTIKVTGVVSEDIDEITIGILIRDRLGNDVFGTNTYHHNLHRGPVSQGERFSVSFQFPMLLLGSGSYSLSVALHKSSNHLAGNYDWWDRAVVFQVVPGSLPTAAGVCNIPLQVQWD
jgi:lipopolysaccharide transport system ATP-binding protein